MNAVKTKIAKCKRARRYGSHARFFRLIPRGINLGGGIAADWLDSEGFETFARVGSRYRYGIKTVDVTA